MSTENRVLSLDGDGSYVEIVHNDGLNAIGSQVTLEAWIKPMALSQEWSVLISKVDEIPSGWANRSYLLQLNHAGFLHLSSAPSRQGMIPLETPAGLISPNIWYHVAGVIDADNRLMQILINGVEVARGNFGADIHISELPLTIGGCHQHRDNKLCFHGQIDDVRIWNIALPQQQIAQNMHVKLLGDETGLVAVWRFEGQGERVVDETGNGHEGKLIGNAIRIADELPPRSGLLTSDQMYQRYLDSLRLSLSVRRIKPDEYTDVLSITAYRVPESTVWTAPKVPVTIDIRDDRDQLLATMDSHTDEALDWSVPHIYRRRWLSQQ